MLVTNWNQLNKRNEQKKKVFISHDNFSSSIGYSISKHEEGEYLESIYMLYIWSRYLDIDSFGWLSNEKKDVFLNVIIIQQQIYSNVYSIGNM